LLKEDGVIFVSIDDNEVAQLRILMDEIFGEENFVGELIWRGGKRNAAKWISTSHEYILFYAKSTDSISRKEISWKIKKKGLNDIYKQYAKLKKEFKTDYQNITRELKKWFKCLPESHPAKDHKHYCNVDKKGIYFASDISRKDGGKWLINNPLTGNKLNPPSRGWAFPSQKEMEEAINLDLISFSKDDGVPTFKRYLKENEEQLLDTVFYKDRRASSKYLNSLFGENVFDFPKDVEILKLLIDSTTTFSDLILDFFAGSGTTGDAVMQLNAEDRANGKEGNRKYILVQLPEPIDPKKNKTAFDFVKNKLGIDEPTIFEITKERLMRAGKKIQSEQKTDLFTGENKLNFGFKIFETQPIWEDYEFEAKEFDENLQLFDESKLSSEDLQTLLTTWKTYDNIALTESLENVNLDGYTGYYGNGRLYFLDKGFETKHLKALLNKIDEDSSFNPVSIIVFGYHFESKVLREIAENVSSYANKKKLDIDFITRY
jgi:adenine-specific DNA-methyltransferase